MYCGKCGKLLLSTARVCSHCGTSIDVVPPSNRPFQVSEDASPARQQQAPAYRRPPIQPQPVRSGSQPAVQPVPVPPAQPAPENNKGTPLLTRLLVGVIAFCIAGFLGKTLFGTHVSESKASNPVVTIPQSESTQPAVVNTPSAYDQFFSDRGIHEPPISGSGTVTRLVKEFEGGIIFNDNFLSKDDLITEEISYYWLPKAVYSEALFHDFQDEMQDVFGGGHASFVTITSSATSNSGYYQLEIIIKDMDQESVIAEMKTLGMFGSETGDYISLRTTVMSRKIDGFIQK